MEIDCNYIDYRRTNNFSELVCDYIEGKKSLDSFYRFTPNMKGISEAIAVRKKQQIDRKTLVSVLRKQYATVPENKNVSANIESLLLPNTFTICTAHQPNLLTGYLYFFYKILHAISLAEMLNKKFPNEHFVPVYYMGSEDNDLDELGQFRYEEKKYKWEANGQKGAVGRMDTKSLKPLLDELFKRLGPPSIHLDELKKIIEESYLQHENISDATQYLVHHLFGKYGLVVLNPDEAMLKKKFDTVIQNDLINHDAFRIATEQSAALAKQYKAQAYPREINLFYLEKNSRERIEKKGNRWEVLNTNITFSEDELKTELANHPEKFSPNVILRGLYQETILPNICFIGGGSELAYWLQLKPLFEHFNVFFPVVLLRQSVQILDAKTQKIIADLNIEELSIFESEHELLRQRIEKKVGKNWDTENEKTELQNLLKRIAQKAKIIDPTLEKSAAAALAKMQKQLTILEQKMYKAEQRKEHEYAHKLAILHAQISPNGALQERSLNFMPYFLHAGFTIFEEIKNKIEPLKNQFLIVKIQKENDETT